MNQEPLLSFQAVLDALLDDSKDFPGSLLASFSDIEPGNLKALMKTWPSVSKTRKHRLLKDIEARYMADTMLSFDDLAQALLSDPDAQIRRSAIRLLWETDDARLVPAFLDILENDPDEETRAESATALGAFIYLGELDELYPELKQQTEDALLAAAGKAKSQLIQRKAVEALGFSSRPEIQVLLEAGISHQDPRWLASTLFAMGRSGTRRWEEHVLNNLRHDNPDVRLAAVEAAGALSLRSARLFLLEALNEELNVEIFRAIIWSLSQIGGEDVQTHLESLLDRTDDDDDAEFIEDALQNLAFNEDLDNFDLMAFDMDDEPEE